MQEETSNNITSEDTQLKKTDDDDDDSKENGVNNTISDSSDPYLERINFRSFRDSEDLETAISVQWHRDMDRPLHISTLLEQDSLAPLFAGAQWAGTRVWHAAIAMIQYLLEHHRDDFLNNNNDNNSRRLLELGCGLGVPGMICHELFCCNNDNNETYLTDQESIISQLEKNIRSNFPSSKNIHAQPLSWSEEIDPLIQEKKFDIVINCDCVYEPLYGDSWKLLVHVLYHVLERNPKALVLVSVERRNTDGINDFLTKLQSSGNHRVDKVWSDEEYKIEIYRLSLIVDN